MRKLARHGTFYVDRSIGCAVHPVRIARDKLGRQQKRDE